MTITTTSPSATVDLGLKLAKTSRGGDIFGLSGPLGSGKTHFVQGFARGLGLREQITSPTFVLMHVHNIANRPYTSFCHADAYRLNTLDDILETGLAEYLGRPDVVCVVEWADKIKKLLCSYSYVALSFQVIDDKTRSITITRVNHLK